MGHYDSCRDAERELERDRTVTVRRVLQRREGGHVQRCHVIPHSGSYSVAEHSWHATMLLLELHPDPSPALLRAVLQHDAQERWTGDLPLPSGDDFKQLRSEYESAERCIRTMLGLPHDHLALTIEEKKWLSAVDHLELWLWCQDQIAFGNQHVARVKENLDYWFVSAVEGHVLPEPVRQFLEDFEWERTTDHLSEE